ncbi:GH16708 [Drosophila grimshawi]|uniref:GH16708 n=2 Tax=Drosophila grimshawi TaxID=7222 RepID=B4J398_DROGR|nr:GH16708 [Drosophila grimshawi]
MLKHGNFATSCPIQRGYYYLHNWGLDTSLVPSFLYMGDYQLGLRLYYGKYKKNDYAPILECIMQTLLV